MKKFGLIFLFLGLGIVPQAICESTDCTTPVLMVADGRLTQSSFPSNTTYWYGIYAQAGHSYAIEFVPTADNYLNTVHPKFSTVTVFGPNDSIQSCRGTSSVSVTQNSGYAPVILSSNNGAGRRVSFTAQNPGLHLISVMNVAGTGNYSFRAIDTTLFNLRWSACSGYDNQWGFLNLSNMPITATFTVYDLTNQSIATVQFGIPAGGEVVRYSAYFDLNLPRNISGYAIFSHNGPPNSILADTYMISPTKAVVTYTKFEQIPRQ